MTAPMMPRLVFASNLVRAHLPPKYWDRECDHFSDGVEWNTLAASAQSDPKQFTVQNECDFLVYGISAVQTTDATGATEQTFWELLVRILDNGSGQTWFNGIQHLHNIAGRATADGDGIRKLQYPRLVIGGATVTVELTNMEANVRRVWMSFHGVKIFRRPRV